MLTLPLPSASLLEPPSQQSLLDSLFLSEDLLVFYCDFFSFLPFDFSITPLNNHNNNNDSNKNKMESIVRCCIHGDRMAEPIRTLPCLHSACLTCLKQYCTQQLKSDSPNRLLECPSCRDSFQVPADSLGGVEALPLNYFIAGAVARMTGPTDPNTIKCQMCDDLENEGGVREATSWCKECLQWACDSCKRSHLKMKVCMHHQFATLEEVFKGESDLLKTRVTPCQKHRHLEVNSFCKTDETAVCPQCIVEAHSQHAFEQLANVAKAFRESISSVVAKVKGFHGDLLPAIAEISTAISSVNDNAKNASDEIHAACELLRDYANEREKQLKSEIEEIRKEKEKILTDQKHAIESVEVGIRESSAMVEAMLKDGSETEIVASQKQIIARFTKLENERKKCTLEPVTDSAVEFEKDLAEIKVGFVVNRDVSADKSTVERLDQALSITLNQSYSIKVLVVDKKGNGVGKSGSGSVPFIVGVTGQNGSQGNQEKEVSVSAVNGKEGEYLVAFTFAQVGVTEIGVCHRGAHFKGSPFRIEVVDRPSYRRDYAGVSDQPVLRFGSIGSKEGQFINNYAVACTGRGSVVVADKSNHRIQIFDRAGKFLGKFGSQGNGTGQLSGPQGVTVDQRNNQIVVVEHGNNRVQVFDENGVFLRVFGSSGSADGQLYGPFGVVVDPRGNYIIAESDNHRVQIFDSNGRFVRKFGSKGNGNGQLDRPIGVGLLSNGGIVVSEFGNSRVQLFDPFGRFVRIIGVGQLKTPYHLFVDSSDNILVADSGNGRLQVFKPEGDLAKTIGAGQLNGPSGICMDGEGRIIVTETSGNRVSFF